MVSVRREPRAPVVGISLGSSFEFQFVQFREMTVRFLSEERHVVVAVECHELAMDAADLNAGLFLAVESLDFDFFRLGDAGFDDEALPAGIIAGPGHVEPVA